MTIGDFAYSTTESLLNHIEIPKQLDYNEISLGQTIYIGNCSYDKFRSETTSLYTPMELSPLL